MKPFRHKAKLAFLTSEAETFFQLEDGRILIVGITRGQLAGFVADGAKHLATSPLENNRTGGRSGHACSLSPAFAEATAGQAIESEPAAHEYSVAVASAATPSPRTPAADAPRSKGNV